MPTTITPVPQFTNTNPTRPSPGEPAGMETGPAPMAPTLQTAFDRIQYVRGITWGTLIGGDTFSVDAGGTSTSFTARLSPFEAVGIQDTDSTFWPIYSTVETTFTQADYAGGTLPNSSWIYAYLGTTTAGVLTKELSTTAPNASKVWKSDNLNRRRYVGCFRTDPSGNPLPVYTVRGRALYRRGAISSVTNDFASGGLRALDANAANGAYANVDLSARVPPHARVALLRLELTQSAGNTANLSLNTDPDTGPAFDFPNSGGMTLATVVEMPTSSSQVVQYYLTSGGGAVQAYGDVMGWLE